MGPLVLRWLCYGLGWGIAARVWMRIISDTPEFSWVGTSLILGLSTLAGLGIGLVAGARETGRRRWWRVGAVLCLPLFAGQGMLFLPGTLLGGAALSRRGPVALRCAAAVIVLSLPVALIPLLGLEPSLGLLGAVVGFEVLQVALAVGAGEICRRWTVQRAAKAEAPVRPLVV